jgi:hypothetical protein
VSRIETRHTGQYTAEDAQGRRYQIVEYTEFHHVSTFGNLDQWVEGLKDYRLSDGSHVNRDSETEFEIVASGVKLRLTS